MSELSGKHGRAYTFFITGGGTGGHVYPALAVVNRLCHEALPHKIFYLGNSLSLEQRLAAANNIEFLPLKIKSLPRKLGFKLIISLILLAQASVKALFYIMKYKPDAVFSTGGYVAAPVLVAAILTGTPFLMHDCDANPGLVSRAFAPFAKAVSLAFEDASKRLKSKKIEANGNPIRDIFTKITINGAKKELGLDENKLTLLVMGGSQGAESINSAITPCIQRLVEEFNLQIIVQTGEKNFEKTEEKLSEIYPEYNQNPAVIIRPYFEQMAIPLKAADITVSRAGSLSLSEICISSTAAILVPYPYAAADHQRHNAKSLVSKNAALYLEDSECSPDNLTVKILELVENPALREQISQNAYLLAHPNAAENIVKQLKNIVR